MRARVLLVGLGVVVGACTDDDPMVCYDATPSRAGWIEKPAPTRSPWRSEDSGLDDAMELDGGPSICPSGVGGPDGSLPSGRWVPADESFCRRACSDPEHVVSCFPRIECLSSVGYGEVVQCDYPPVVVCVPQSQAGETKW